jgi:hypothetical protein
VPHAKTILLALLAPLSEPASEVWAEGARFSERDPACQQIATVQFLDCQVDVVYRCPPVDGETSPVLREEFFDKIGPSVTGVGTRDGLLIELFYPGTDFVMFSDPTQRRSISMETMIATGTGHFSTAETITSGGVVSQVSRVIDMSDIGKSIELGQARARVFRAAQVSDYPLPLGRVETTTLAYLVPALSLSLSGDVLPESGFKPGAIPHRPVKIALPGAPDFVTTRPAICGPD